MRSRGLHSMPSEDDEAALAQAVGEHRFHLYSPLEGHGIQVRIEAWHEPLAMVAYDAGAFDAVLVVLEPLLGREPGHADVITGLPVAIRVSQIDDVDGMVPFRHLLRSGRR